MIDRLGWVIYLCMSITFGIEDISVPPEEDEVSLIVESEKSPGLKVRRNGRKSGEEPGESPADHGVEVVDDEFGKVVGGISMMFYLLVQYVRSHFENGARPQRQIYQNQLFYLLTTLPPHHQARVLSFASVLHYLGNTVFLSWVVITVRETTLYLLQKREHLSRRRQ